MLGFAPSGVHLACGATDLRKSFDTLAALVRHHLHGDPLSGQLFVFCNGRCNRIKVLFWDRNGFWVCAKRLEKGTFDWPEARQSSALSLTPEQWALLLGGLEWLGLAKRKWFEVAA